MRTYALAIALMALFAAPGFSQDVEFGPGGVRIEPGFHEHHEGRHEGWSMASHCRELRAACMHKEELGEQGQGNCHRYREVCGH